MNDRAENRTDRLARGLRLYIISGDDLGLELTHEDVLEVAILSGATAVEFSAPTTRTTDLVRRGQPLRALARERGVLFFVLNDVDAVIGLEADGVFLSRGDRTVRDARKLLGRRPFIGVPIRNLDRGVRAEGEGADFVRVGAVLPDTQPPGLDLGGLKTMAGTLSVPVVASELSRSAPLEALVAAGIAGVAACDEIVQAEDTESATLRLRARVERSFAAAFERTVGAGSLHQL